MMIKVGDLVYVAKPTRCCGNPTALGWTFTVTSFNGTGGQCVYCDAIDPDSSVEGHPRGVFNVDRLKRIDPLSEDERNQTLIDIELDDLETNTWMRSPGSPPIGRRLERHRHTGNQSRAAHRSRP